MDNIESTKENTIRKIIEIPKFKINNVEVNPFIIIDKVDDKIRVLLNKTKLCRCLHHKNDILQAIDILLVDNIKKLLNDLAIAEEKNEEEGGGLNGI